jgi:hypothetical protein
LWLYERLQSLLQKTCPGRRGSQTLRRSFMIPPIIWIRTDFDESPSPFLRGKTEQPLKITFHTSSFAGAPSEEIEAIEALRQLSNLTEIDAIDTESGGPLFHLETATLENGEARQWSEIAAHLTGQTDPLHPEVQAMLADLLVVKAHCRMRRHLSHIIPPTPVSSNANSRARSKSSHTFRGGTDSGLILTFAEQLYVAGEPA